MISGMSIQNTLFVNALKLHQQLYVRTDGLIGHRVLGAPPSLLLRTTGRKSGQTRTNALTYARDGGRYLVVASRGGDPRPPAWLLNLQAEPNVEIQVGRDRYQATATVIGHDDPDFERVWKIADENNAHRYRAYQQHTDRPIPVVALTRAA
jgi:deazaflavin-dependent oxidoreductase (nitroreductase family)